MQKTLQARQVLWLLCGLLLIINGCARPSADPGAGTAPSAQAAAPPAQAPAPTPPTPSPVPPAPAAPAALSALPAGGEIQGGGTPDVRTTVESVAVAPAGDGLQAVITFKDGVPVWAAHVAVHGRQLQVDLGAPAAPGLQLAGVAPGQTVAGMSVSLGGGPVATLLTVTAGKVQVRYEAAAADRTLTVIVRPGPASPLTGRPPDFPGMERATAMVESFLQARAAAPGPGAGALTPAAARYLGDVARLQVQHLYGTEPLAVLRYRMGRQSGQWPGDLLYYLVRLEGEGWFADEMLFVAVRNGEPYVAMLLGHPPVAVPPDADGQAALHAADVYLDAESRRNRDGIWAALSPSEQKRLGGKEQIFGGLSNPHPFRYEIHAIRQAGPGCWRLDVLRSVEYTGEGELGWGVGPFYVTKEDGRFGALREGTCGEP